MKKIILLAAFVSTIVNSQELTLTLQQSLEIGLKNSKELVIAKSKIDKASALISETSSAMLPKLSLNARYTKLSDVPPFQVELPILPQPVTIQESILDNYNLSLSIEQPLFTGFRLSSLKSASQFNQEAESIKYEKELIDKADEIQKAFWNYYTTQKITELVKENLEALKAHLKNTNSLLENGLVTRNDLLKLKVEVANIELKLIDANNNYQLTRALFNKTIGYPLNRATKILAAELSIEPGFESFENLQEEAKLNRQDLKSTRLQINALKERETAAMADFYPQLFAFGNLYYSNPNQRFMPLENKFNDSWDVGVALKWQIWNWGGTSAKVEQAKQNLVEANNNFALLQENVDLDVYNNFLNLEKAKKKIELSELQVESAEENYRITKQKYYEQLATSTDLIDAETSLLNAKTNLVTAKVEYQLNSISLEKSIGRNSYSEIK